MIAADQSAVESHVESENANATSVPARRHVLRVDFSERGAGLLALAQQCPDFDVRMDHLDVGDYSGAPSGMPRSSERLIEFTRTLTSARHGVLDVRAGSCASSG